MVLIHVRNVLNTDVGKGYMFRDDKITANMFFRILASMRIDKYRIKDLINLTRELWY